MKYRFGIIGLGRVGGAIMTLMRQAGHTPVWAVSSKAGRRGLEVFSSLPDEPFGAEVVFLTVPDSVIEHLAEEIAGRWGKACDGIAFFHFSGLFSSDLLESLERMGGEVASLHPLQSIMDVAQAGRAIQESFFTVEGSENAAAIARDMVSSIGSRVKDIAKQDKVLYHAAAVIASNYLVSLAAQAEGLMEAIGLSLDHLIPLIRGTVSNIEKHGRSALTGPVQRGDWATVGAHLTELDKRFPDILPSYLMLGQYTARLSGKSWPEGAWSPDKVLDWDLMAEKATIYKNRDMKLVFTNGCFDIIHEGHVSYLRQARALGDALVVGLNSDESVSRLKGHDRPINNVSARAAVLACLECVDHVCIFTQDTPYELIDRIRPDILVKGGDWKVEDIVGSDIVKACGGEVYSLPFRPGHSTTGIINKIRED